MLAMEANDNAGNPMPRGALRFFVEALHSDLAARNIPP
jgi:hypothetical protein